MNRSLSRHGMQTPWTRRRWLGGCGVGLLGLSLPNFLALRGLAAERAAGGAGFGRARSCILLYCWGGISHLDTWDPKPQAPAEVRGEFKPIATSVPGVRFGEHMPQLARQMKRLAVVRAVHHSCTAHGKSMYWNRTGHAPPQPEVAANLPPSLNDWPTLGAQLTWLRPTKRGLPGAVQLPYPLVDNGTLQAGDTAGWLGSAYAPLVVRPNRGKPYGGVSRDLDSMVFRLADDVDAVRLNARRDLS